MRSWYVPRRYLIVNADDFGLSPGINRGVIEAHERGIVTSASLMVRGPAADQAAAFARGRPTLSIGIHIDLGEWTYHAGSWIMRYQIVPLGDMNAIQAEVSRQLDAFRRLLGADPTHIDSHQHVHLREPVRSILAKLAGDLEVPLRHHGSAIHHCGHFYGQSSQGLPLPDSISTNGLLRVLSTLPQGTTELACHPAATIDFESMYRCE